MSVVEELVNFKKPAEFCAVGGTSRITSLLVEILVYLSCANIGRSKNKKRKSLISIIETPIS